MISLRWQETRGKKVLPLFPNKIKQQVSSKIFDYV
jgi:hypothetical protein